MRCGALEERVSYLQSEPNVLLYIKYRYNRLKKKDQILKQGIHVRIIFVVF